MIVCLNDRFLCTFHASHRSTESRAQCFKDNDQNSLNLICLQDCVIKGCHVYTIRPPVTNPPKLLVDREYLNIHDHCALFVLGSGAGLL